MGSTPHPGTHFPPLAPLALFSKSPRAQKPPTLGPLSLMPGGPQEGCGLQPAGRFPSQRPLCPHCKSTSPGPWGQLGLSCLLQDKATFSCVPRSPSGDQLSSAPEVLCSRLFLSLHTSSSCPPSCLSWPSQASRTALCPHSPCFLPSWDPVILSGQPVRAPGLSLRFSSGILPQD